MSLLEVRDLNVRFPTEDGVVHAVRDVSFDVASGELLGIVGESGSGKSVTSLAVMGLLPASARISGTVAFESVDLLGLEPRRRCAYRGRDIAMVFQDPMTAFNPVHRVGWQLVEAIRTHQPVTRRAARARAIHLLDLVGVPHAASRIDNYPHEFSGGMRQRAMIAMAVANEPKLLIADEPTTALDVTVQAQILEMIAKIRDESDVAVILITHDLGVVAGMATRMLVMYGGAVVEAGTVDDIYYRPRMPYTVGLLNAIPRLDTDHDHLVQIPGSAPSLINTEPGCSFAPRCPLAAVICATTPPLATTDTTHHLAACHRWRDMVPDSTDELFRPQPTT